MVTTAIGGIENITLGAFLVAKAKPLFGKTCCSKSSTRRELCESFIADKIGGL
jgi:hypothetical protein